jgi:hypothetical protein
MDNKDVPPVPVIGLSFLAAACKVREKIDTLENTLTNPWMLLS